MNPLLGCGAGSGPGSGRILPEAVPAGAEATLAPAAAPRELPAMLWLPAADRGLGAVAVPLLGGLAGASRPPCGAECGRGLAAVEEDEAEGAWPCRPSSHGGAGPQLCCCLRCGSEGSEATLRLSVSFSTTSPSSYVNSHSLLRPPQHCCGKARGPAPAAEPAAAPLAAVSSAGRLGTAVAPSAAAVPPAGPSSSAPPCGVPAARPQGRLAAGEDHGRPGARGSVSGPLQRGCSTTGVTSGLAASSVHLCRLKGCAAGPVQVSPK